MLCYVICEESQAITQALRALGHEAYSVDTQPTRGNPEWHYQIDAIAFLSDANERPGGMYADLVIIHPPCTYLANSGARWQYDADGSINAVRNDALHEAAIFYRLARYHALRIASRVAIENPVWHRRARTLLCDPKRQFIQPWFHGVPQFKATGWELHGIPPIPDTERLTPPKRGTPEHKAWSSVHREPPGPNRQRNRSATHPKLAAMYAAHFTKAQATAL